MFEYMVLMPESNIALPRYLNSYAKEGWYFKVVLRPVPALIVLLERKGTISGGCRLGIGKSKKMPKLSPPPKAERE